MSVGGEEEDGTTASLGYRELLNKLGTKRARLVGKLVNNLSKFKELYSFLREDLVGSI